MVDSNLIVTRGGPRGLVFASPRGFLAAAFAAGVVLARLAMGLL